MPTATTSSARMLKPISILDSKSLRSLYHRAARAFLNHDIPLAHSLLTSAFHSLQSTPLGVPSALLRKWDILRITFETTVYSTCTIPDALKELSVKSPQVFVSDMYRRSLVLFGKFGGAGDGVLLPAPVLSTLVYSSLKVECPDMGRVMIEEWLARRGDHLSFSDGSYEDGYRRVLELYCLQVLPKLEQWEYATELLEYESELSVKDREKLKATLRSMHSQTLAVSLPDISRTTSPAPSSSSSSSSLSTKSTNTIVPSTPRANPPSTPSDDGTITPHAPNFRTQPSQLSSPHHIPHPNSLTPLSTGITPSSAPPASPSTYALIKASLAPYFSSLGTTNRGMSLLVFLVVVPVLSLVLRIRRRRRRVAEFGVAADGGTLATATAEVVRKRLGRGQGQLGLLARVWWELVRAVVDTIKMGGSGLV